MDWLLLASIGLYCIGVASRIALMSGIVAEILYIGGRGMALGRLPLLGPHDTLVFFSISIGVMLLLFSRTKPLCREPWFRAAAGMGAALPAIAAALFRPLNMPLPQILDTVWFEMHVVLAFFAYALFLTGGIIAAGFLRNGRKELLDLQYKAGLIGWSFFSASMITGGIWGYYAWGTYWLWTPKELWTSILWLFYALVLHLRLQGPSWERIFAWLNIAGFFVMLFTYLGVSLFMKSSHSF